MLTMRDANIKDKSKQEDLTLLVKCNASGCTNDQIRAIFQLITNKHANKELQQYFDQNQEKLKNDPKKFANITTIYPQIQTFLSTINATYTTKGKILTWCVNHGKPNALHFSNNEVEYFFEKAYEGVRLHCNEGHDLFTGGG